MLWFSITRTVSALRSTRMRESRAAYSRAIAEVWSVLLLSTIV